MKSGDIVVNLGSQLKVKFIGWVAGRVCTFKIITENGWENFDGTYEELLKHCAKKIEAHNKHVFQFGGELI